MITLKAKGIEAALKSIDSISVRKAAQFAVNESAKQGRTEASYAIRDIYNLGKRRVDDEVRNIQMATGENLEAVIKAEGRPIGLMNFGAKWVRNVGGSARTTDGKKSTKGKRAKKSTGVFVKTLKGKTTHLPQAFIGRGRRGATDGAGAMHVFQRRDLENSQGGIINKAMITIASMLERQDVMARVQKKVLSVVDERFRYHLRRLTK